MTADAIAPRRMRLRVETSTVAVYGLLAITMVVFALLDPGQLDVGRVSSLIAHRLPLALVAVGQTIVIINKGFDLSVSGIVALTNVVVATTMGTGAGGIAVGVLAGLAVGLLAGLLNGALVGFLRLPAIIVTLATWSIFAGLALYVLPQPGGAVPSSFAGFAHGRVGPVPIALVMLVGLPALLWWPIARSRAGHRLYAVGGDERAAYESGISVAWAKVGAFALAGLFAALGAIFLTMQAASGDPRIGDPFTLNSIAAVALGGTLLTGGRGSVAASIAGALVLGTLSNVLFFAGVSTYWQFVVAGGVLILAVALSALTRARVEGANR